MADEKDTKDVAEETKEEQAPEAEEKPAEEKKEEAPAKAEEAPAADEADEADEAEEVEVPKEFEKLVAEIEGMSVLQLNELVKVLEKKFGVSAAAVAAAPAGGADAGAGEEQTSFNIELSAAGGQKIAVIKVVKEVAALGLKEAKELVEGAPAIVKEGVGKEEAEEIKKKLEEAGATVALK